MIFADDIRAYCLQKAGTTEGFPFGPDVLVFKHNKMYCLLGLSESPITMNVKCDPEIAILLREKFDTVLPGYHMNKQHWNTVVLDGSLPNEIIYSFIDWSYNLISKIPIDYSLSAKWLDL